MPKSDQPKPEQPEERKPLITLPNRTKEEAIRAAAEKVSAILASRRH